MQVGGRALKGGVEPLFRGELLVGVKAGFLFFKSPELFLKPA